MQGMSYLVLARKYRPRNFAEMVGQDHVVRALANALQTQRLHHAYLFTGTRGVGKTTVSRILAKSLNCQGPDGQGGITATPCGVCQSCRDIDAGRFIDYTELDAASNRGVDEVQALLEQAVYKPVQGRFKVFMIDEVHMLTNTAFNAMLKTLEEPPDYLKFVLATTDPQKVPVTVLSRCLQFNLRPMAPETISEHLERVFKTEGVVADVQSLRLIARCARGSMRDALSLSDQAIAFGSGEVRESAVRQMLGSVDSTYALRLIESLALGDGKSVVEIVEELRLHGLSAAAALEEMAAVLERMLLVQVVGASDADDGDPQLVRMAQLAGQMPADEIHLLYSICLHGRADLGLAPDEYAALTMVLLRLLAFKPASATAKHGRTPPPAVAEKKSLPEPRLQSQVPAQAIDPATGAPTASEANVPELPPGKVLAVRTASNFQSDAASALTPPSLARPLRAPSAPVLAVPVRVAAQGRSDAAPAQQAQVLVPTADGAFWHDIVEQLIDTDAIAAMVRELALQSQLLARDTDQWILRVERESLNQSGSRDRLAAALHDLGFPVRLVVEVGRVTDSPVRRRQAVSAQKQLAAEKLIYEDPFVQSMMRDFGAKIVPGSIRPL
jgi:DNA polymerase-3 subunit gamma/tau